MPIAPTCPSFSTKRSRDRSGPAKSRARAKDVAAQHRKVFEARANLIWKTTTPQARRGHFAMGVGLEAGLTIDAMAEELADLIDRADAASLPGDVDELADALAGLGERLLVMRPFIPDKKNALPGELEGHPEAVGCRARTSPRSDRRTCAASKRPSPIVWSGHWKPSVPGACPSAGRRTSFRAAPPHRLETGVPQFMMSMLIRAGLPSRRAAMAAIETTNPVFVTPAEMRAWLESDEITAYTDAGDWPTPDTAALWARFRTEALSGGIQKWSVERYKRLLDIPRPPRLAGLYRIITDEGDGRTWLATPDYRRVAAFKKPAVDPKPSLFSGRLAGNTRLVEALRVGRGKLRWPQADA